MTRHQVDVEFRYHKATDILKVGLFVGTLGHKLIKLGHVFGSLFVSVGGHQVSAAVNQAAWLFRSGCR